MWSLVFTLTLVLHSFCCLRAKGNARGRENNKNPGIIIVHGYSHHVGVYETQAKMFMLSINTWIVNDFDLIVRCENIGIDHENLKKQVNKYPHQNKTLIHLDKPPNYKCGQFNAISEMHETWQQYSMVLWMNPDVFMTPPGVSFYKRAITEYSQHCFFVTRWQARQDSYNTDFIMFRPSHLRGRNVFGVNSTNCSTQVTEVMYANIVRGTGSYVELFDAWHGTKTIDKGGVWHTHNIKQVNNYIKHFKEDIPFAHRDEEAVTVPEREAYIPR